eukprot:981370-Rhodomonas_salina.1
MERVREGRREGARKGAQGGRSEETEDCAKRGGRARAEEGSTCAESRQTAGAKGARERGSAWGRL